MVNKVIIIMHIIAYLAIIVVNALAYLTYSRGLRAFVIDCYCNLAIYSACTVIFGLIVN